MKTLKESTHTSKLYLSTVFNVIPLSTSLRFDGYFFPTVTFSSFYRCSFRLSSALIADTQDFPAFSSGQYVFLQNVLIIFVFHLGHSMPDAAKQPHNLTEPPPCFTAGGMFFSLKASAFFCEHRTDVICQKALTLFHLSE